MAQGRFITFEGGEGVGKSTQITRLASRLRAMGRTVTVSREPGGSAGGEAIRALLVSGDVDRWSPVTEALLMNAARRDHIERVLQPALARGDIVLCDRFADSTRAYQGAGGGVPADAVAALEALTVGATQPDLTLILDLPASEGLSRAQARAQANLGGEARFEGKGIAFHERLRAAFLSIAEAEPGRCVVIDASGGADAVEARIWTALRDRWPDLDARP
jgi:dTMP kinase